VSSIGGLIPLGRLALVFGRSISSFFSLGIWTGDCFHQLLESANLCRVQCCGCDRSCSGPKQEHSEDDPQIQANLSRKSTRGV
jgi:hypothetical protein